MDDKEFIDKTFVSIRYRCTPEQEIEEEVSGLRKSFTLRKSVARQTTESSDSESSSGSEKEQNTGTKYFSSYKIVKLKAFDDSSKDPLKYERF